MQEDRYREEIREIFELVKEDLSKNMSQASFDLWFGTLEILSFDGSHIQLGVSSSIKHKVLSEQYLPTIAEKFSELLKMPVTVDISLTAAPPTVAEVLEGKPAFERGAPGSVIPTYNFEYTFENFIVGSTNKFAHAACLAVATHPATNYNPLFIYGNSGLGKTHLMNAIINRLRRNNPNIKIIYTKGEDFTNEMVTCLAVKDMEAFRDKYRTCDVLLIDDIQFIAGKVATQQEFFHTFNTLFEEKKQIILTSDRPPREIQPLEDRLRTRFEWGLLADIEPPDLELRIAIIKKKAEQVNVTIPDEVLVFLAENLRSNIRQLEGAIKKLGALSFLSGQEITMEIARVCLSELLGGAEPVSVTVDRIIAAVSARYGVSREEIVGSKRNKEIADARHIAIYLIRNITEMSLPNIGKMFGKDHSTVLSSIQKITKRTHADPLFNAEISDLKKDIAEGSAGNS